MDTSLESSILRCSKQLLESPLRTPRADPPHPQRRLPLPLPLPALTAPCPVPIRSRPGRRNDLLLVLRGRQHRELLLIPTFADEPPYTGNRDARVGPAATGARDGAGGVAAESRRRRAKSAISIRGEAMAHRFADRWRWKVFTRNCGDWYSGAAVLRRQERTAAEDGSCRDLETGTKGAAERGAGKAGVCPPRFSWMHDTILERHHVGVLPYQAP